MAVATSDPTLDFVPLFADQDESTILARWIDWANEGLDPIADASRWVDTREGGHWRTGCTPGMREAARLYDLIGSEVPMCAFVLWAWGTYLDDKAAEYDVQRVPASFASGVETFSGPAGTTIYAGTELTIVPSGPDDPAPSFVTTVDVTIPNAGAGSGSIDVGIRAVDPGAEGNVAAHAIVQPSTPIPDGVTFTNAAATSAGAPAESDDRLRTRVLEAMAGKGPGTVADYLRWALGWPGVGSAKVVPVWAGPNTVLVTVGDEAGQPLSGSTPSDLQTDLDPVPGQGHGTAPVGAQVTVNTYTVLTINLDATLTYETGYSWAGTGNTVAVGPGITQAIVDYFETVPPGGEVVHAHVGGLFATAEGVHDAPPASVLLNGGTGNVAVSLSPPRTPKLGTVTLH